MAVQRITMLLLLVTSLTAESPSVGQTPSQGYYLCREGYLTQLPPVQSYISGSYQTFVEVKDVVKKSIRWVEEVYDDYAKMGRTSVMESGEQVSQVYYYSRSQQLFFVRGMECKVMSQGDPNIPEEDWLFNYHTRLLYGPSAFLWRTSLHHTDQGSFSGQTPRWEPTCNWSISHLEGVVDYYLQAPDDWSFPYQSSPFWYRELQTAPLRVEERVFSIMGMLTSHVIYDFFLFRPQIDHPQRTDLMVPLGLSCSQRKSLDPTLQRPRLPDNFRFSAEIVSEVIYTHPHTDMQLVKGFDIYYSRNLRVMSLDLSVHSRTSRQLLKYKIIFDVGTGVKYSIDTVSGTCVSCAIGDACGAPVPDWLQVGKFYQGAEAVLGMDLVYLHAGSYFLSRGRKTSAWTNSTTPLDDQLRETVTVLQFSTGYKIISDIETLMQWNQTTYDLSGGKRKVVQQLHANVLDFEEIPQRGVQGALDVRECFLDPADRTFFRFTFAPGELFFPDGLLHNHVLHFKNQLFQNLQVVLGYSISPLRLSQMQVDLSAASSHFNVTLLVLEDIPDILRFLPSEPEFNYAGSKDAQMPWEVASQKECAEKCVQEMQSLGCESFSVCGGRCYLSPALHPDGNRLANVPPCLHWQRSLLNATLPHISSRRLFLHVEALVADGAVDVMIEQSVLLAKAVQQLDGDDGDSEWDQLKGDFYAFLKRTRHSDKVAPVIIKGASLGECAFQCSDRRTFECESFSRCSSPPTCYLSPLHAELQVNSWNVVHQDDCTLYAKKYIAAYREVPGDFSIAREEKSVTGRSVEQCAFFCSSETSFTCRSFEYCPWRQTCALHSMHYLDAKDAGQIRNDTGCEHFSRDYLVDFKEHEGQSLQGHEVASLVGLEVGACAKACEDIPSFGCQSFDLCQGQGSTLCLLKSAFHTNKGVVVRPNPLCNHYSREYYAGKDRLEFEERVPRRERYHGGDMAGMAVGMLCVGMLLATACCALYVRRSPRGK